MQAAAKSAGRGAKKARSGRSAPRGRARVRHILGESLECFAAEGFDRVTYDDLIRRSKVSRGSFYWYFPSKEALYDAVLDYCVSGYVARLDAAYAQTSPTDHVVTRLFDAALADFNANRSKYRVLLRPPPSRTVIEKMVQWNDDVVAFMGQKLAPLVADGRLDAATAKIVPDVISAFIDGICVRLVLDDESSVSTLSRNIQDFLCRIVPDGKAP